MDSKLDWFDWATETVKNLFRSRALIIVFGFLASVWLWSTIRDWCLLHWTFLCHAVLMEGPPALPIIGNFQWITAHPDDILKRLIAMAELFAFPIRFWLGPKLVIAIKDPSEIKIIMNHSGATYKPSEYRFTEAFFGRGLITSSGPTHEIHRNLIMPMVNGKTLNVYVDSFDTQSRRCVECLESMVGKGEFDIMPFMDNCTVDIIMDTIIGCPALAQQNGYTELIECITELFNLSHERTFKVVLHPDWIYFRTQRGKQHKKAVAVVNKFMDDIVAERKKVYYQSRTDNGLSNLSTSVLLNKLLPYNEANQLMDDIRLRDEVFTVFLAAQDPTALTCAFTFMMLGMHSDVQDKVRDEVEEVVGDNNLTAINLAKLKYLDMVIKETLRLFPVGSILLREAQEDIQLGTCTAPKGCTIAMFLFMTCRDPRFWNEPDKYNPDRFLPENSVGRHPYAFVPFASGFRGCIGRQFAMMMMKSLVVRVVQKYRLHSHGSLENLRLNTNISIRSLDGYKVSITKL